MQITLHTWLTASPQKLSNFLTMVQKFWGFCFTMVVPLNCSSRDNQHELQAEIISYRAAPSQRKFELLRAAQVMGMIYSES